MVRLLAKTNVRVLSFGHVTGSFLALDLIFAKLPIVNSLARTLHDDLLAFNL